MGSPRQSEALAIRSESFDQGMKRTGMSGELARPRLRAVTASELSCHGGDNAIALDSIAVSHPSWLRLCLRLCQISRYLTEHRVANSNRVFHR